MSSHPSTAISPPTIAADPSHGSNSCRVEGRPRPPSESDNPGSADRHLLITFVLSRSSPLVVLGCLLLRERATGSGRPCGTCAPAESHTSGHSTYRAARVGLVSNLSRHSRARLLVGQRCSYGSTVGDDPTPRGSFSSRWSQTTTDVRLPSPGSALSHGRPSALPAQVSSVRR